MTTAIDASDVDAAVALLAERWAGLREQHRRHEGFRALAGGLLHGGLAESLAESVVESLVAATGDAENDKRVALVKDTAAKLRRGGQVTGWPTLARLLGDGSEAIVRRVQQLLGCDGPAISATYDYRDEAGCLQFQTVRYHPKDFKQRRPDGKGGWIWNLRGVERLLYRLPELLSADPAAIVYIAEGEKDVDALWSRGLIATTNPLGAGKWQEGFCGPLRGRHVVILSDNDEPGRKHASQVARSLAGAAASFKVLQLPNLPDAGDVSDWLAAGGTAEGLQRLAEKAPLWQEAASPAEPPAFSGSPRPLSATLLPVPPLNPAMIPAPLRGWLVDIAQRGCFPLEYPTAAAIEALAAVVGRKLGIRPKRHDDWLVVPNLWGAIVGPPSIQKTPGAEEAMLPLKRLVAQALAAHEAALAGFQVENLVAKAQAKAAREALDRAAKGKPPRTAKRKPDAADASGAGPEILAFPGPGADLKELAKQALLSEKDEKGPVLRRYVVNDATVEKLGEILAENPNGVLTFRDELTGFLKSLDREGHENDRGFYLEGWAGTGGYVYDRIGRGTLHIPYVCISLFGTIQPGPLARYIRASLSNNDGLMPRFQLLLYPDPPGKWVNVDRYPDSAAKNRAYEVFKALDAFDPRGLGVDVDEDRHIPWLRFAPEAQDLFDEWRADLENRLRTRGDSPVIQCHLGKYRSLMPSLALLFHLVDVVGGSEVPPVTQWAAAAAAAWCDLLEAHCRRAYQAALDGDPEAAQRLVEHLKSDLPNPFRVRDVARKGWAGLTSTQDVELAVGVLEDRGWLQSREVPAGPAGGRPTAEYWIHPELLGRAKGGPAGGAG
jgi:putative DNA primase/helicase